MFLFMFVIHKVTIMHLVVFSMHGLAATTIRPGGCSLQLEHHGYQVVFLVI